MKGTLRGIFLTSDNPSVTARFYQQVAGLPLEPAGQDGGYQYWRLDDGQMQIAIHDAKLFSGYTHPAVSGSNTTHLYFKIADQGSFLMHLDAQGVKPDAIDDVVVTVADPDGRKIMFGTA